MSQASVVVARSSPVPSASPFVDFSVQQKDTMAQFLQVTPLLLYIIKKSTNSKNFKTQTFCLYGEPYSISSDHCEVKGGRFGVEVNEDFDKDIAFVIGYVGSKSGIEFFNPNLSCVAKMEELTPTAAENSSSSSSSGSSGSSNSGSCGGNKKMYLEKRFAYDSLSMDLERKRKGFLEISNLVVRIGWETIAKITAPTATPASKPRS